ncbi:hypothetical protein [Pelagicoccus sp. SDUM812002]|uniref:hypothetical protein n=1 Tax=Pelagicoccus sp. SDUM812002 TaxID=3041266 RepID=UPI002811CE4B|nr:hypothetical protein [Pelagicoccus sp. SDUM812002]
MNKVPDRVSGGFQNFLFFGFKELGVQVMTQRRHGNKGYNGHRPLGRSQLKQRFLRARENPLPPTADLENVADAGCLAELGPWPYEISNYCCESCYREAMGYADEEDLDLHSVRLLLDTLLHPDPWVLDLEQARDRMLPDTPMSHSVWSIQQSPLRNVWRTTCSV